MSKFNITRHFAIIMLFLLLSERVNGQWLTNQEALSVLGQPNFTTSLNNNITSRAVGSVTGIAIDPTTGKVFVNDPNNHRVLRFSAAASLTTGAEAEAVFGQLTFSTNTADSSAQGMNFPTGIAVDKNGRLYVAEQSNHRVIWFNNASTKPSGASADGVIGQPGFNSRTAGAGAAAMASPTSLALDTLGNLYVSEITNHRVLRFNDAVSSLQTGQSASAVLGQADFISTSSGLSRLRMNQPFAMATDTLNTLFVADRGNHRILIYRNAHVKASGAEADSVLGQPGFTSNSSSLNTPQGLSAPSGLMAARGDLYISASNRIVIHRQVLTKSNGARADTVLGQDNLSSFLSRNVSDSTVSSNPRQMILDREGNLFVADLAFNRVVRYSNGLNAVGLAKAASVLLQQDAFSSSVNEPSDQRFAWFNTFSSYGIAVDTATGKVFISDPTNHRVLRFSSQAALQTNAMAEAVFGQQSFLTSASSASIGISARTMNSPRGLAMWRGSLFVADHVNNRILRFDNASTKPSGADADGVLGQPNFTSGVGTFQPSGLIQPLSLSFDQFGNLYVSSSQPSSQRRYDDAARLPNGAASSWIFGRSGTATDRTAVGVSPSLTISPEGALYIATGSNIRVLRFDNALSKVTGDSAEAVFGGGSSPDNSFSFFTAALLRDRIGNLYVADRGNLAVRLFQNAETSGDSLNSDILIGQEGLASVSAALSANAVGGVLALGLNEKTGDLFAGSNLGRVSRFRASQSLLGNEGDGFKAVLAGQRRGYAFGNVAQAYFTSPSRHRSLVPPTNFIRIKKVVHPSSSLLPPGIASLSPLGYEIERIGLVQDTLSLTLSLLDEPTLETVDSVRVLWRENDQSLWQRIESAYPNATLSVKKNYVRIEGYYGNGIIGFAQDAPLSSAKERHELSQYELMQNYPNPFNPSTTIRYQVPERGVVTLAVYDVLGRRVATLVNQRQDAGRYDVTFNASGLTSGMYFYRITSGSYTKTLKMTLVK